MTQEQKSRLFKRLLFEQIVVASPERSKEIQKQLDELVLNYFK